MKERLDEYWEIELIGGEVYYYHCGQPLVAIPFETAMKGADQLQAWQVKLANKVEEMPEDKPDRLDPADDIFDPTIGDQEIPDGYVAPEQIEPEGVMNG